MKLDLDDDVILWTTLRHLQGLTDPRPAPEVLASLRAGFAAWLEAEGERDEAATFQRRLAQLVRLMWLSDTGLDQGHGLSDVVHLVQWLEDEFEFYL